MLRRESRQKRFDLTNSLYIEALSYIRGRYPFFNESNGQDHVFVFPGARGPTIFNDCENHIKQSLFLTPEGDRRYACVHDMRLYLC